MSYNDIYARVQRALLQIDGEFDMDKAVYAAFKVSEKERTKEEITNIAIEVLDSLLNNGMIKYVAKLEGKEEVGYAYESIFSQENNKVDEGLEK